MAFAVPEATIEEIKARTDIGELVASYGIKVYHAGSSQKACCPFHHEKTPSFHINASRGFYHCFGCGESGDAIKFVQKFEGLSFMEAVKRLASRCGIEIKEKEDPNAGRRKRMYGLMAELSLFYRRCLLKMKDAQFAREYLAKRDLDEKTQEDFMIGYAPEGAAPMLKWADKHGYTLEDMDAAGVIKKPSRPGDRPYHRFSGRLMLTVRDKMGRVVAFSGRQLVERKNSGKYVNSPETEIFKKSLVLYGFDKASANIAKSPHREVIVCEGQIDCIRLHTCGFPVAVASQGTAFTEEHVKMISRVADCAALAFDDDAAGHKAAVRSAGMLLAAGMPVRVVRIPDGDDPDSYLRKHGGEAFAKLLENAESVVSFQCRIERLKESRPDSLDAVSRITKAVLSTIAACPNAVLRANMIAEASSLLKLPASALSEELSNVKAEVKQAAAHKKHIQHGAETIPGSIDDMEEDEFDVDEGLDAASYVPPPRNEIIYMSFLIENEDDDALMEKAHELIPPFVFSHSFTRGFIDAFFSPERRKLGDMARFYSSLHESDRGMLDLVLGEVDKGQSGARIAEDDLREFTFLLWGDFLVAAADAIDLREANEEAQKEHSRLFVASMFCKSRDWEALASFIEDFKKGKNQSGH